MKMPSLLLRWPCVLAAAAFVVAGLVSTASARPAYGDARLLVVTDGADIQQEAYSSFWSSLEGEPLAPADSSSLRPCLLAADNALRAVVRSPRVLLDVPRHQGRKAQRFTASDPLREQPVRWGDPLCTECEE